MYYDIYKSNHDKTARFALGRTGTNPVFIFGINPSTANDMLPDMTMRKVEGFASRQNFDGFVMLNIYPFRATRPDDLPISLNKELCEHNIEIIQHHLRGIENPVIWAAWGDLITKRPYLAECLTEIRKSLEPYKAEWRHCGVLTKAGNPRHPSRLAYSNAFQQFNLPPYLCSEGHSTFD